LSKVIAIIPARLASSRLNEKVLLELDGEPIVVRVYNRAKSLECIDDVIVATDSSKIIDICKKHNVKAVLTSSKHTSGSDRVFEVIEHIDCDFILNIQGDEPFFSIEGVEKLVKNVVNHNYEMGTLGASFTSQKEFLDPNNVKVVINDLGFANYFSRSPIPYSRDGKIDLKNTIHHIGVYIYKKDSLEFFVKNGSSSIENIEKLEQLRFLQAGRKIYLEKGNYSSFGIDTIDDYIKAKKIVNKV